MSAVPVLECVTLLILFILSGFFSSAETALFCLNPAQIRKLRRSHPRAASHIENMLVAPTRLLSTILIGNTIVNIAAADMGFVVVSHIWPAHGEVIAIPAMTILLLLFGELTPKRLAMAKAELFATVYAPLLVFLISFITPLRWVLERTAGLFVKNLHAAPRSLTEDEFLGVIEEGEAKGVLDKEERTMVDGIISLEDMQASDVMTPRVDLVGINLESSLEEMEQVARSVWFHYLPIYRGDLDNIEGLLDLPRFLLSPERNLDAARVPACFIPETAPLDTILTTFQKEQRRVAIVVDEYGGTAGLITRGDVLEEIVDDVESEHEREVPLIEKVGERSWLVDGSISLEDINDELGLALEAEGADRIAGWVSAQAERVPRHGEVVEAQGCKATVQRVKRNRVVSVLLEVPALEREDGEFD
ncbi:MAG: HlyC/CorC family transporter [Lentisphaerae bacterium]|nr:HlyC/CorC family transporter [Lentisphaerota bacterium]